MTEKRESLPTLTPSEGLAINHIILYCEQWGYGRVMQIAADAWKRKDPVGALTVGPCVGMLNRETPPKGLRTEMDVKAIRQFITKLSRMLSSRMPRCRDCADENGTCPMSDLPCDTDAHMDALGLTFTPGAVTEKSAESHECKFCQTRWTASEYVACPGCGSDPKRILAQFNEKLDSALLKGRIAELEAELKKVIEERYEVRVNFYDVCGQRNQLYARVKQLEAELAALKAKERE